MDKILIRYSLKISIYKDLLGKLLNYDWEARVLFPKQIFLIFGGSYSR